MTAGRAGSAGGSGHDRSVRQGPAVGRCRELCRRRRPLGAITSVSTRAGTCDSVSRIATACATIRVPPLTCPEETIRTPTAVRVVAVYSFIHSFIYLRETNGPYEVTIQETHREHTRTPKILYCSALLVRRGVVSSDGQLTGTCSFIQN